jgi:hypothetical protein
VALCKPALGKNGKIKPDWVIVKGREEHHSEGNFYVHRYEGSKEIWKKVGPLMPRKQYLLSSPSDVVRACKF